YLAGPVGGGGARRETVPGTRGAPRHEPRYRAPWERPAAAVAPAIRTCRRGRLRLGTPRWRACPGNDPAGRRWTVLRARDVRLCVSAHLPAPPRTPVDVRPPALT